MSGTAPAPALSLQPTASGDLLTLSFADPQSGVCGHARITLLADGTRQTLVAVFEDAATLVATAVPEDAVTLSAVSGGRWSARWRGAENGDGAFELALEAAGPAAPLSDPQRPPGDDDDSSQQPCAVTGTVNVAGRQIELAAIGQIGLVRAAPDWSARELWREIDCWMGNRQALTVRATRPAGSGEHAAERVAAVLIEGEPRVVAPIDETRVSTVYDREGRQRQAGLELWAAQDSDYPRRLAGHVRCAATVRISGAGDQPTLRWDCAFLHWHMEGEEGLGPYSIVRPAGD